MNLKEKISSLNKKSDVSKEIKKEISKLPTNEEMTKEILEMLGNKHTKIVLDEDIKNSYYVYLNDTIYLSNKQSVIEDSSRVMLISHEARHSVQSKILQILNFLFSNLELIAFVINIVLFALKKYSIANIYPYLIIFVLSVLFRFILEIDAVVSSVKISRKYLIEKINKDTLNKIIEIYSFKAKALIPLFLINLYLKKVIRLALLIVIYFVFI